MQIRESLFEKLLNKDALVELNWLDKEKPCKIENIKDLQLRNLLMTKCHSLSVDNDINTSRYELIYPDVMPSCFVHWKNETVACIGYKTIKLYKGMLSDCTHIKCHVCSPQKLNNFCTVIKKYGAIVNAKIVQAHSMYNDNYSFPRLPHLHVDKSTYVDLHYSDFTHPDHYLDAVVSLSHSFVKHMDINSDPIHRLNIERFYGSIYTHAWTWLLTSKAFQKELKDEWPNLFEKAFTALKAGETYGIVCGPMVTHDLAEAFLIFISKEIMIEYKKELNLAIKMTRRMDTFNIQTTCDLKTLLSIIEDVLDEYNLSLRSCTTSLKNSTDENFHLKRYLGDSLTNTTYNTCYLDGYDSDLIALMMFKSFRDSHYLKDVSDIINILSRVSEVIPIICNIFIDDYLIVNNMYKETMATFAIALIGKCNLIDSNSIQYLHLLWLSMCCNIAKDHSLFATVPKKMPSLLLYTLFTHTKDSNITKLSSLDIGFKEDMNEFYTKQLCNGILESLKLHYLLQIAIIGTGFVNDNINSFATYLQDRVKCTIVILDNDDFIDKYDYVIKQSENSLFTENKNGISIEFSKWNALENDVKFKEWIGKLIDTKYRTKACHWCSEEVKNDLKTHFKTCAGYWNTVMNDTKNKSIIDSILNEFVDSKCPKCSTVVSYERRQLHLQGCDYKPMSTWLKNALK